MEDKSIILKTIREWYSETKNFRNDGWVQSHFRKNIEEVKALIDSFEPKHNVDLNPSENVQEEDFAGTLDV